MATSLIKDKGEKEKLVEATDSKIEGKLRGYDVQEHRV